MFVRIRTMLLIATLLLSGPLSAAILVVNTFNSDAGDANVGLAGCDSNPGLQGDQCTLRAAIMQANATATLDQIVLPVSTEIILNNAGLGDQGDLDITEDVVIGVLAIPNDVTTLPRIRATFADRIFDISNNAQVTFQGVILEDGDAGASNGGAIRAAVGSIVDIDRVRFVGNRAQSGGAIHNAGLMFIEGSDFTLNRCVEGGSAVMNTGTLTFSTSSIRNIRDDPSLGQADAIRTADNSTLNVLNSTIDGSRPLIGATDTGGITAITPASLRVRNSTLTDFSDYALFVSVSPGDDVVIANNILDDSDLFDCQISLQGGATVDQARVGWNQISNSNCGAFFVDGNISDAPILGTLEASETPGQITHFHTPSFASPGVDEGTPESAQVEPALTCLDEDQIGQMRPLEGDQIGNARCDMGAIELSTAPVATYLVNVRNTDAPDANLADPNCDVDLARSGNQCTLRAAVMQANHKPGPDRIQFDHTLGDAPFQLNVLPGAEPSASVGDLNVTEELLIEGEVLDGLPRTRIVQTVADRVFRAQLPPGQSLTLRHLDIRGGDTANLGGAAWISSGASLILDQCVLRDNHAASGGAVAGNADTAVFVFGSDLSENSASSFGAAIHAAGSAFVNKSSLRANIALHADATQRSAVHAPTGSTLVVNNSTMSRNSGGIWTRADATSLQSNTIVLNDQYGLRVIQNGSNSIQVIATILAHNGASDCSIINTPNTDMNRYNLIADGSCPGGATNLTQDPVLAPEAMRPVNRLTWVHWPLNGSPVFDAVPDELFLCFDEDQLGNVRPTDTIAPLSPPTPACEIGALEVFAAQADPKTFQVNATANDQVDMVPGDTLCDVSTTSGEQCTLRAAVMEANALSGFNSISLGQPNMMVTLTRPPQPGPDSAADGDLDITDALAIVGIGTPSTRPTIGFGFVDRIFDISAAGDTVSIDRLRLSGGFNTNSGGAIRVLNAQDVQLSRLELSGNVSDAGGGALAVLGGSVTLTDSDLHNNQTAGLGAAIRNNANLTIRSSSIRDNDDQSVPIEREAIAAEAGSVTEIINSTLARNSGTALAAVDGDVVVRSSTIVDHDRFGVSLTGGMPGPMLIANSVFHANTQGACLAGLAAVSSDHFNAADGTGCQLESGQNNLDLDDPLLGTLVIDPTRWSTYFQPDAASALRDAGNPLDVGITACLGVDQLNSARPIDGDGDGNARCDIGAIEAAFVPLGDNLFGNGFE